MEKQEIGDERSVYWCVVSSGECWTIDDDLPFGTASELSLPADRAVCIGEYQQTPVMWLDEQHVERELEMTPLRHFLCHQEALFLILSKAIQYGHMANTMRFCPQCGGRNHMNHSDLAMQCGECRTLHYPRISPCIIVAVRHQKRILLANHARHRSGMYTVIAGFLEVGETLEQCVAREVKEETGIDVHNIRYAGSQPWAFPSNIMVGFFADYKSGDIKVDEMELSHAEWFDREHLPPLAPKGTIARSLIDRTIAEISAK